MLIDPFTIIAQIVNFLILVFLLWHFLYKPVTRVMDEREQKIEDRIEEAKRKEEEAEEEKKEYEDKQAELERKRESMIGEAKKEAEEKRKELIGRARKEAEEARRRWSQAVEREKEAFLRDLKRRAVHEIYRTTGEVIRDLADKDIESGIIAVFIRRIREMESEKRDEIKSSLSESDEVTVQSSFEVDEDEKEKIRNALHENLREGIKISFATSEEVVAGIELAVEGYKIAWSVADYLGTLEEGLSEVMEKEIEVTKHTGKSEDGESEEEEKEEQD